MTFYGNRRRSWVIRHCAGTYREGEIVNLPNPHHMHRAYIDYKIYIKGDTYYLIPQGGRPHDLLHGRSAFWSSEHN